jgi:hypothetical protein
MPVMCHFCVRSCFVFTLILSASAASEVHDDLHNRSTFTSHQPWRSQLAATSQPPTCQSRLEAGCFIQLFQWSTALFLLRLNRGSGTHWLPMFRQTFRSSRAKAFKRESVFWIKWERYVETGFDQSVLPKDWRQTLSKWRAEPCIHRDLID